MIAKYPWLKPEREANNFVAFLRERKLVIEQESRSREIRSLDPV
jgi:hypothetical protein